jgi:VWFA-related protein
MTSYLSYRKPFHRLTCGFLFISLCFGGQAFGGQEPAPAGSTPQGDSSASPKAAAPNSENAAGKPKADNGAEISQTETAATFKVRVNLVQVRVIVRDPAGKAIDNLTKQDFLLYDQGKPQFISNFSVETPQSRMQRATDAAKSQDAVGVENSAAKAPVIPERFVGVVFDDLHLSQQDATFVRQQAGRFLDSIGPTDRVAIYSTSGQNTVEFTADKEKLHRAILGVVPHPLTPQPIGKECPQVTYYMADQIENKNDSQALAVVIEEAVQCAFNGNEAQRTQATALAQSAALRSLSQGDVENQYAYRHIEDALRRLAAMPGERIMMFVSPGFVLANSYLDESGIIDRANRSNIVVHTIDARGLYVPDVEDDISRPVSDFPRTAGYKTLYRVNSQFENQFVLSDFAYGTGGTFFHNSNDLESAFQIAGLAPEVSYVLAFSPQNRKMDGRYHTLSVKLAKKSNYSVQARRGYYAPRKAEDPHELAREEIQEAIFSQEEISDLPLDLQTQYFKGVTQDARLSVVSRLELKNVHFRKADGRSNDELTLATAIFDENGNYVTGGEKTVQMRLLDATYERLTRTGLTVKSSFSVKPGRYLVRQVVRDSEGSQMAARNGAVEIPF